MTNITFKEFCDRVLQELPGSVDGRGICNAVLWAARKINEEGAQNAQEVKTEFFEAMNNAADFAKSIGGTPSDLDTQEWVKKYWFEKGELEKRIAVVNYIKNTYGELQ